MTDVLRIMTRVAAAPLWALWWLYGVIYWAFEPDPKPAEASGQDASFEVTDSRPRVELPVGALRGGFVGSLALSCGLALIASAAARGDLVQPASAWALWAWASAAVFFASTFAVRHAVRKREERRARIRRMLGAPVRLAAGAKAACMKAASSPRAAALGGACVAGAKRGATLAGAGVRHAASGSKRLLATLLNPVRPTPPAPPTAAA